MYYFLNQCSITNTYNFLILSCPETYTYYLSGVWVGGGGWGILDVVVVDRSTILVDGVDHGWGVSHHLRDPMSRGGES